MRHMRHRYFVLALAMMVLVACDRDGTEPPLAARLELGQSLADSAGAMRTIELVPDAAYMIAVVNTSATEAGETGFALHGELGPGGVAGPPAPVPDLHVQLLDRDRRLFRRLRAPSGITAARRRAAALLADVAPSGPSPISLHVGDVNTLTIRDIRSDTDCTDGTAVQARTVYVSNKLVILEDVTAPLAGEEDDFFRQMGEEYDALTYPEVVENFGDPLALLPGYAPIGRVVVLLSPILNQYFGGVAGFVSGCDFYPRSEAPIGNQQLIFYDFVATGPDDRASWEAFIRSVAAHETKHLASYATRFTNGANELPVRPR